MTAPKRDAATSTRKLLRPFVGLLLLISALQLASLVAIQVLQTARERARSRVDVMAEEVSLAEQYDSKTYLALVGLATSDWEMLLQQRSEARELTEAFKRNTDALLGGGKARLATSEVELARVDSPEITSALRATSGSSAEVVAAHIRVLRSENRSLKANPDLDQFRRASRKLQGELVGISGMLHRYSESQVQRLARLQSGIVTGTFLVSALMGLFVFQRIILPLGVSMESLRKSEEELRAARDELEQRVEERTAELARTNEELRDARDGLERRVEERTAELARTNESLQHQTEVLNSMLQSMGDGVLVTDAEGRFVLRNAMASMLLDMGHADVDMERWCEGHSCLMADGKTPFPADEMPIRRAVRGDAPEQVEMLLQSLEQPKGIWLSITGRPLRGRDEALRGSVLVFRDVSLRKQSEEALRRSHDELEVRVRERTQELKDAQRHSLELARQAGMAELASNMLHNVGNVLHSANTSTVVLGERLRSLRVESVQKLGGLLEEHRSELSSFLTTDERGRMLPDYIGKLGQRLVADRDEMLGMVDALVRHVEHLRNIVDLQQSYATSSSFVEPTSLEELVEDALRISSAALGRHHIKLARQIEQIPRLLIDKHRVLQILLNLVSNAKYALDKNSPDDRRLTLRIARTSNDQVCIEVRDNGMGIPAELLTKIFQHGFTTRKEGHGFGLHSSALAAKVMGGSLSVHSEGVGRGATFTLLFPYRPDATEGG